MFTLPTPTIEKIRAWEKTERERERRRENKSIIGGCEADVKKHINSINQFNEIAQNIENKKKTAAPKVTARTQSSTNCLTRKTHFIGMEDGNHEFWKAISLQAEKIEGDCIAKSSAVTYCNILSKIQQRLDEVNAPIKIENINSVMGLKALYSCLCLEAGSPWKEPNTGKLRLNSLMVIRGATRRFVYSRWGHDPHSSPDFSDFWKGMKKNAYNDSRVKVTPPGDVVLKIIREAQRRHATFCEKFVTCKTLPNFSGRSGQATTQMWCWMRNAVMLMLQVLYIRRNKELINLRTDDLKPTPDKTGIIATFRDTKNRAVERKIIHNAFSESTLLTSFLLSVRKIFEDSELFKNTIGKAPGDVPLFPTTSGKPMSNDNYRKSAEMLLIQKNYMKEPGAIISLRKTGARLRRNQEFLDSGVIAQGSWTSSKMINTIYAPQSEDEKFAAELRSYKRLVRELCIKEGVDDADALPKGHKKAAEIWFKMWELMRNAPLAFLSDEDITRALNLTQKHKDCIATIHVRSCLREEQLRREK